MPGPALSFEAVAGARKALPKHCRVLPAPLHGSEKGSRSMWNRASSCAGSSGRTDLHASDMSGTAIESCTYQPQRSRGSVVVSRGAAQHNDQPRWITCSCMQVERPITALPGRPTLGMSLRRAAAVTSPHAEALRPQR